MKIFIAGATGAIGRYLLPRLTEAGHEVTAMTRSQNRMEQIRQAGAKPVVCDVFDRDHLKQAMVTAQPEIVIHQLTNLPQQIDPRRVEQALAQTNRLRTEGTEILMEAAKAAGTRRFIAQSVAFYYAPTGSLPATEDEQLYKNAPADFANIVHAVDQLEHTVLNTPGIDGTILRYGYFYGPGTAYAEDGSFTQEVRRRRMPIIGNGNGVFSFVHVEDAAIATILALNNKPGIYNIVDDEPAPIREWLPSYADMLNAPRPMRLPKLIGRLAAGRFGVYFMTEQRGASNKKAKEVLGWRPRYPSWRDGFRAALDTSTHRSSANNVSAIGVSS
ncbi:MAG: NAD(P)-dependent oxidoreductase [Anaerolineae bacterium]|nr:NAD(P)-dependent oxidoreductase [Anaerolineae bacterium]